MRRAWPFAALSLAASPLSAKEAPWPSGIYGNVRMSAETGDLGGLEARFYDRGGKHMVEYVLCEGWCNGTTTAELRRDGADFAFDGVVYSFIDGERRPETQHIRLRPKGRTFVATIGTGEDGWKIGTIKPAKEAFGLAVATGEEEAAGHAPD